MDIVEKLNKLLTDTTAHAMGSVDISRGPYGSNIMGMRYIKRKKKVKGGAEYPVHEAEIFDNPAGSTCTVEKSGTGYYVEVNNRYDLEFENKKELDAWLKSEKYRSVGHE